MAIYVLVAILDKKVGACTGPQMFRSKAEAIRSFSDAVADEKGQFCKHPEDFVLMYLGSYNDQNGVVEPNVEPLITALECVKV